MKEKVFEYLSRDLYDKVGDSYYKMAKEKREKGEISDETFQEFLKEIQTKKHSLSVLLSVFPDLLK